MSRGRSFVEELKRKRKPKMIHQEAFNFLPQCDDSEINWTIANPMDSVHPAFNLSSTKKITTKLTPLRGNPELIQSAKNYFIRQGIDCDEKNIVIGRSTLEVLNEIYRLVIDKDANDTVLLPVPTYGMFYKHCVSNEIKTEFLSTTKEDNWQIDPEILNQKLLENPNIKILLLNFPNNPTGAVMGEDNARAIAEVLKKYPNVLIVCDEILLDIPLQPDSQHYSLARMPELKDRIIVLNSISKSRGFAGTSVSFVYFPSEINDIYQQERCLTPSNEYQEIVAKSLENTAENQAYLSKNIVQYHRNIDHLKGQITLLNQKLNEHFKEEKEVIYVKPYIENPESGNVMLLDFSGLKGAHLKDEHLADRKFLNTGLDVAKFLLDKANIGVVPGECFFIDPEKMIIRVPISTHQTEVEIGFKRISEEMIQHLEKPTIVKINTHAGIQELKG